LVRTHEKQVNRKQQEIQQEYHQRVQRRDLSVIRELVVNRAERAQEYLPQYEVESHNGGKACNQADC
jgi:hypothetical protein